jgi:uncharacterized membrane protein YfcA
MTAALEFWYLFPLGIGIAITAMAAGISGANLWFPVYFSGLAIEAKSGLWLAMLTMVFGFGSGVIRNIRAKTIQWRLARRYLLYVLPLAVAGGIVSNYASALLLTLLFSLFIVFYGLFVIRNAIVEALEATGDQAHFNPFIACIGGFLQGIVATGLGKMMMPQMLKNTQITAPKQAVGTTVLIVFIANLVALITRTNANMLEAVINNWSYYSIILLWVVPSVIIGGQIGPYVASLLSRRYVLKYVGSLLVLVGGITTYHSLKGVTSPVINLMIENLSILFI